MLYTLKNRMKPNMTRYKYDDSLSVRLQVGWGWMKVERVDEERYSLEKPSPPPRRAEGECHKMLLMVDNTDDEKVRKDGGHRGG